MKSDQVENLSLLKCISIQVGLIYSCIYILYYTLRNTEYFIPLNGIIANFQTLTLTSIATIVNFNFTITAHRLPSASFVLCLPPCLFHLFSVSQLTHNLNCSITFLFDFVFVMDLRIEQRIGTRYES